MIDKSGGFPHNNVNRGAYLPAHATGAVSAEPEENCKPPVPAGAGRAGAGRGFQLSGNHVQEGAGTDMFDLVIENCNLFNSRAEVECGLDLAVSAGKVAAVGRGLARDGAGGIVDGTDKLLIPGFVDPHTHLDKALTIGDEEADGLEDAISLFTAYQYRETRPEQVRADIRRRAARVLDMEIAAGTTCIRTHVLCDDAWGMESVYVLDELRREYADRITMHLIVPWYGSLAGPLDEACRAGMIDFFAGYAHIEEDYRAELDGIFDRVEKYGILPDLHSNESDAGDLGEFLYIQEKGLAAGLNGKVNCSHVTAMCAASDGEAARAVELAARLETNIITLPSCNMYLMGRHDSSSLSAGASPGCASFRRPASTWPTVPTISATPSDPSATETCWRRGCSPRRCFSTARQKSWRGSCTWGPTPQPGPPCWRITA
jgi:cytosine deaminase